MQVPQNHPGLLHNCTVVVLRISPRNLFSEPVLITRLERKNSAREKFFREMSMGCGAQFGWGMPEGALLGPYG